LKNINVLISVRVQIWLDAFFEIHSEFQFSVNYRCFYPELWETWFLSFKRVYLAMRAKGYMVTTDNLQNRYCRVQRDIMCNRVLSVAGGQCGVHNGVNMHCPENHFCSDQLECQRGSSANFTGRAEFNYENVTGYFDVCKDAEKRASTHCSLTYNEFCDENAQLDTEGAQAKNIESNSTTPRMCNAAADGYDINWSGLHCGVKGGSNPSDEYLACDAEYPLRRIHELLKNGAQEFPEIEFEKKTPTTLVMVGYEQQCKERYLKEESDDLNATDDDYEACIAHHYNGDNGAEDVDFVCTRYSVHRLMDCLNMHGKCEEWADSDNVADENRRPWASDQCGEKLLKPGQICDNRLFKDECFKEKWNGRYFNSGASDADTNSDGMLTLQEKGAFYNNSSTGALMDGIGKAFNINADLQNTMPIVGENSDELIETNAASPVEIF